MDWESLKYFAAVARLGSLTAAGKALKVQHSTVLRRLSALEAAAGLKLFDRRPDGYALTATGREMYAALQPVEDELLGLERLLAGKDLRLSGEVRAASVNLLSPWLAQAFAQLSRRHPNIVARLLISPARVDLSRHEADIAVRITAAPPPSLAGRRVASLAHGVYGAPDLADDRHAGWIAYDAQRADLPQAAWLAAHAPPERILMRTNNTLAMLEAARAGVGLAVLPCFAAERAGGLVRRRSLGPLGQDLWLLTHPDLRQTPRIRAVLDFLWEALTARRGELAGEACAD